MADVTTGHMTNFQGPIGSQLVSPFTKKKKNRTCSISSFRERCALHANLGKKFSCKVGISLKFGTRLASWWSEVNRNAKTGETGDPRGNPPTSGFVRHDSPRYRIQYRKRAANAMLFRHLLINQRRENVRVGWIPRVNPASKVKKRGSDTGDTNTHFYDSITAKPCERQRRIIAEAFRIENGNGTGNTSPSEMCCRCNWVPHCLAEKESRRAMRRQACVLLSPVSLPRLLTFDMQLHSPVDNEVLRADEGEVRYGAAPECKGGTGDPRENPLTDHRPDLSTHEQRAPRALPDVSQSPSACRTARERTWEERGPRRNKHDEGSLAPLGRQRRGEKRHVGGGGGQNPSLLKVLPRLCEQEKFKGGEQRLQARPLRIHARRRPRLHLDSSKKNLGGPGMARDGPGTRTPYYSPLAVTSYFSEVLHKVLLPCCSSTSCKQKLHQVWGNCTKGTTHRICRDQQSSEFPEAKNSSPFLSTNTDNEQNEASLVATYLDGQTTKGEEVEYEKPTVTPMKYYSLGNELGSSASVAPLLPGKGNNWTAVARRAGWKQTTDKISSPETVCLWKNLREMWWSVIGLVEGTLTESMLYCNCDPQTRNTIMAKDRLYVDYENCQAIDYVSRTGGTPKTIWHIRRLCRWNLPGRIRECSIVRCGQMNTQRSTAVAAELNRIVLEQKLDMVLFQEPYVPFDEAGILRKNKDMDVVMIARISNTNHVCVQASREQLNAGLRWVSTDWLQTPGRVEEPGGDYSLGSDDQSTTPCQPYPTQADESPLGSGTASRRLRPDDNRTSKQPIYSPGRWRRWSSCPGVNLFASPMKKWRHLSATRENSTNQCTVSVGSPY
ncbi:hypothetical protein PR048_029024 [Dryococelus australis]|uniref:Uncharacterized protein n=1 Tax=Dryococelus australis TaxID=614101 RepID=A0ABQ9GEZ0_9NEOP|nr:hypothetical protein PR048_029024 [Dryococelus australis]